MNVRTLRDRFSCDSEFSKAVKLIESIMYQSKLTPLDIRDACYLARLKFEETNVRPIILHSGINIYEQNGGES